MTRTHTNLSRLFPGASSWPRRPAERPDRVREPSSELPFLFSERHLQCVWVDPVYRPGSLRSDRGETVEVENPGRWNLEAGPDFLDAQLRVGPERRHVRGDVEIHVHPSHWVHHQHARDLRYRRVIAHVCYYAGSLPAGQLPPGALSIALRDALSRPGFSFDSIDVTAYPYQARTASPPPCRERLAAWSPDNRAALLDAAGEERLRRKAARLQAAMSERDPGQIFYEEFMGALGYKHNRNAFRELAAAVPLQALRSESGGDPEKATALLLGVATLLPAKPSAAWDAETRLWMRRLWDHWWKLEAAWGSRCLPRTRWRLAGLRPANHPIRRMAAAVSLFAGRKDLLTAFQALDPSVPARWFAAAESLLTPRPPLPYWERRTHLGATPHRTTVALLGPGRTAALLANVVIPFLAAGGTPITPLLPALPPEEENQLVRQMAFTLFGPDHNPALYASGLRQQGLLQAFHDFCLGNRSGCRDCALLPALARP